MRGGIALPVSSNRTLTRPRNDGQPGRAYGPNCGGLSDPSWSAADSGSWAEEGSSLAVRADQAARLLGACSPAQQMAVESQTEGSCHARFTRHKIAGDG